MPLTHSSETPKVIPKYLREPNRGFTLIETMISIVILGVGLLALTSLQLTAIRGNSRSMLYTQAVSLAENKIEELKNTIYDNIFSGTVTEENIGTNSLYKRTTIVENDTPIAGTKTVTVSVNWISDIERTVSFSTIISRNGV